MLNFCKKNREIRKTWFDVKNATKDLQDGWDAIEGKSFDHLVNSTMGMVKKHLHIFIAQ